MLNRTITRVAEMYMQAAAMPNPGTNVDDLGAQLALMNRLIARGEARRLGRTSDITLSHVTYDGARIEADVQGVTGQYESRITIRPRPGHHCTCPDWRLNGVRVGPCKHVLRLGEAWADVLVAEMENL